MQSLAVWAGEGGFAGLCLVGFAVAGLELAITGSLTSCLLLAGLMALTWLWRRQPMRGAALFGFVVAILGSASASLLAMFWAVGVVAAVVKQLVWPSACPFVRNDERGRSERVADDERTECAASIPGNRALP